MIFAVVSPYSFDGSVLRLEELIKFAKAFGMKSLFLCDRNFHAAVHFNKLCRENGLVPVHGLRLKDKIFYARSRNEFEELVSAYNQKREPNTPYLSLDEVKLVYFLKKDDFESHLAMCKILSVEPKQDGYFSKKLYDPAEILKATSYDLKVDFKLPEPERGWLRAFAKDLQKGLLDRFLYEVEVVEKLGFESYFYVVKQIIDIAKEAKIQIGPGRGSAVGSVVSYALGITSINPVEYDLMFERFLNEYRNEPPDIDIDVEDERRYELIQLLNSKFPFVAQISTFSRLSERSILNELRRENFSVSDETVKKLIGLPFRRSIHASGVVISKEPLNIPLVPDLDQKVTEYDIYSLEDVGVIKIDLLGLTTLSFLKRLKEKLKIHHIPIGDKLAYSIIKRGQTLGVFQLESQTARKLCRQVRPDDIEELSILLALNRPGPLMVKLNEMYARRKRGCENQEKLFPETKGVIVYQEQVMKLAMDVAGLSAAESDLFRKAVSGKDPQLMKEALEKLKKGMQSKGYSKEEINHLVNLISKFAEYAFNKSHSIAYSHLSYELAYLKRLMPKEFFFEYIRMHSTEKDKKFLAVQELINLGFKVLPASVNLQKASEDEFVMPLEAIEGVSDVLAKTIYENSPYSSIEDFVRRTNVSVSILHKLVMAGAFDCIYGDREKALNAFEFFRTGVDASLLEIAAKFGKRVEQPKYQLSEKDIAELEETSYGFPLTPFSTSLKKYFAPVCEVFTTFRILPVCVEVKGSYASDGKTIFKLKNAPSEGEYLLVLGPDCEAFEIRKIGEVLGVIYELFDCFDEQDFENASQWESTKITLGGKKVILKSVRPVLDSCKINILPEVWLQSSA
ncbi:helix-hairpin-helix domain-containing protein [Pseudothermotoga thermarum]|uniref:DNA-directed DNA polymerase n=1 Tax=Pseudothermotoga thermarum DSM 5069 TaxID=688269 RepID=F7YXP5_9THEM|nr:DNA polymerase III subunit alpha [Pseudothermotoga thermarum]AEH50689.1 DNA polymerase III, alpha subunit [Pseudothermotoga thermarum DSM 5069]